MAKQRIFALGFFDGVHIGHQALLRECCRLAAERGCDTAACTFDRHPQSIFVPAPPLLITTTEDRKCLLRRYGIQTVYTYSVTHEVMATPWQAFLEELMEFGAAGFVCGDDFRFGAGGAGNAEKLCAFCEEHGLPCVIVPEQTMHGTRVSSTHIRGLLEAGRMAEAVCFLGHPHILTGQVISGRHIGRTIGIPTANLALPEGLAVPAFGVYACRVELEGREHLAVTNVGKRPTVGGHRITVESWILDFDGDLYGKTLTLRFFGFIRPEKKFDSLEDLRSEIQKNAAQVRNFFQK